MFSDKDLKAIAEEAGVSVVSIDRGRQTQHAKVRCKHQGVDFFVLVNAHMGGSDQRCRMNAVADFRKARKAVEQKDPTLMKKYLGLRSPTSTSTPKTK